MRKQIEKTARLLGVLLLVIGMVGMSSGVVDATTNNRGLIPAGCKEAGGNNAGAFKCSAITVTDIAPSWAWWTNLGCHGAEECVEDGSLPYEVDCKCKPKFGGLTLGAACQCQIEP